MTEEDQVVMDVVGAAFLFNEAQHALNRVTFGLYFALSLYL